MNKDTYSKFGWLTKWTNYKVELYETSIKMYRGDAKDVIESGDLYTREVHPKTFYYMKIEGKPQDESFKRIFYSKKLHRFVPIERYKERHCERYI
jgi:hypothetical protein